jgi:hypothetical protein
VQIYLRNDNQRQPMAAWNDSVALSSLGGDRATRSAFREQRPSQRADSSPIARKVLGWPKRCKLAHAFLWEFSYKRLKLAQPLCQLAVFPTRSSQAGVGRAPDSPDCPRRR